MRIARVSRPSARRLVSLLHSDIVVHPRWVCTARVAAGAGALAVGIGVACSRDTTGPDTLGIADVAMTPDTLIVAIGDSGIIRAQPVTTSGAPVNGMTLFWSTSDSTIAKVDQHGTVAAAALGAVNVDASTVGVSPRHPARVIVVATPVASIVIAPKTVSLHIGDAFQFTDTTKDASGLVLTGRPVVWSSSDTTVVPVDQAGLVLGKKSGTVTITAASGNVTATAMAAVNRVSVNKIVIAPINPTVIVGLETQLSATPEDSLGNVLNGRVVTWTSSDGTIASIDQSGTATGKKAGSTTITATSEGISASVTLRVQAVPVNTVVLSPQTANLLVGQQQTLTAEVTDNTGSPITGATVTFSSGTPGVATVTATGPLTATVTAVGAGQAQITGASGGKSGTAVVNVSLVPVASVTVSPSTGAITLGSTIQLAATVKDSAGNTLTGRSVTWQSLNAGVAKVSAVGLVTSVGIGTTAISASSGGKTGLAEITVNPVPVGSVAIAPKIDTVGVNARLQLSVTVKDSLGHTIPNPSVTWTSTNSGIAPVSSSGLVLALNPGTVQIIAQSGTKADTNTTVVVAASVASVGVTIGASSIAVGQTTVVTATSKDGSGNVLQGEAVTWKSGDNGKATVSAGGIDPTTQLDTATVTGVATNDNVTITATSSNNVHGEVHVQVTTPPATNVTVAPASSTIYATGPGNNVQLTGTTTPTGIPVTWSNGGSTVANVDGNGRVNATGQAVGSATITATSTNSTASGSAQITVIGHVKTVTPKPGLLVLSLIGMNNTTATATLLDTFGTDVSAQREVTWTSSDPQTITINNSANPVVADPATKSVTLTAVSVRSLSVTITATTDDGTSGSVTIAVGP